MSEIALRSIGTVFSTINEKKYDEWGKVSSELHLNPEYIDGLLGLEEYSHIIIVFYMDAFKDDWSDGWKKRPRGIVEIEEKGCFAQRTKYRPNPIGLSTVKLLSIKENILFVQGLDANNGTKVLDIKPYLPIFDSTDNSQTPKWMEELMDHYF